MMDFQLSITVFRQDGKEEEFLIEPGAPVTLGSLPGCTIAVANQKVFTFTLLIWDKVERRYLLHLTDAMKGELFADGATQKLADCRTDGAAQGVECLGLWIMPLPTPCSGYLTVAGIVLRFELEAKPKDKSDIQALMRSDDVEDKLPITEIISRNKA